MKPLGRGNEFLMNQMEKTSGVSTRVYNDFPRTATPRVERRPGRIWFFEEGSGELRDLLGGKGAGLA